MYIYIRDVSLIPKKTIYSGYNSKSVRKNHIFNVARYVGWYDVWYYDFAIRGQILLAKYLENEVAFAIKSSK